MTSKPIPQGYNPQGRLIAIAACMAIYCIQTLCITHTLNITVKPQLLSDAIQAQFVPLAFFILMQFTPIVARRISAQGIAINSGLLIFGYGSIAALCATGHLPYVLSPISLIAVVLLARTRDPRLSEPNYELSPRTIQTSRPARPLFQPIKRLFTCAAILAAYTIIVRLFTGSFDMTTYPQTFRTGFTIHATLALVVSACLIAAASLKQLPLKTAFPTIIMLMTIGMISTMIIDDNKDIYLLSAFPILAVMMISPSLDQTAKSLRQRPQTVF